MFKCGACKPATKSHLIRMEVVKLHINPSSSLIQSYHTFMWQRKNHTCSACVPLIRIFIFGSICNLRKVRNNIAGIWCIYIYMHVVRKGPTTCWSWMLKRNTSPNPPPRGTTSQLIAWCTQSSTRTHHIILYRLFIWRTYSVALCHRICGVHLPVYVYTD